MIHTFSEFYTFASGASATLFIVVNFALMVMKSTTVKRRPPQNQY